MFGLENIDESKMLEKLAKFTNLDEFPRRNIKNSQYIVEHFIIQIHIMWQNRRVVFDTSNSHDMRVPLTKRHTSLNHLRTNNLVDLSVLMDFFYCIHKECEQREQNE